MLRIKYHVMVGLALALTFGLASLAPAERSPIQVFRSPQLFSEAAGQIVFRIDFAGVPAGSLAADTYQNSGVIFKTDQPLQAHLTAVPPSLAIEQHMGAASTKVLISEAIPVAPNALTIQFPPGTRAAGCALIMASGAAGAQVRVEAQTADQARADAMVTAAPKRSKQASENSEGSDQPNTSDIAFIGFASGSDIRSIAISIVDNGSDAMHNFGIENVTIARAGNTN